MREILTKIAWYSLKSWVKLPKELRDILLKVMWNSLKN